MKKIVKTDKAPGAIGPYNQAIVETNTGFVFTAGQIPLNAAGEIVGDNIVDQAHQVFRNLSAVLDAAGSGLDKAIKVTVFLKDMNDFVKLNGVYSEYFKSDYPARSAIEVARLPKDVLVEIEVIAHI